MLNLGTLQAAIDAGRLDTKSVIDAEALVAAKVLTTAGDGVRLLGVGALTAKVSLKLAGASATAKAAVEAAGGSIELPAPATEPLTKDEQKAARAVARAAKAAALAAK